MIERGLELRGPLDLATTLGPLAHGRGDATIRLSRAEAWLAFRTVDGPATLHVRALTPTVLAVSAWGDGANAAIAGAVRLVGEDDRPELLVVRHPILRNLQRQHPGLRLPHTGRVFHALVPSVLEQKVTGTEAFRAYAALLRRYGQPAPGPGGLLLPPPPETLASLPYHAFHPLGVERRRADVIRRAAGRAAWLDASTSSAEATRRLRALAGIGPWTAAEVVRTAFGDPDAVSIGDFHIPNSVAWALAGEPRGTDERMVELRIAGSAVGCSASSRWAESPHPGAGRGWRHATSPRCRRADRCASRWRLSAPPATWRPSRSWRATWRRAGTR